MKPLVRVIVVLAGCCISHWPTFYYCSQRFDNYVGILVWTSPWLSLSLSLRAFVFLKELVRECGCSLREEDTAMYSHFECFTAPQNYWQRVFFSSLVQWAWYLYKRVVESLPSSPLDPRLISWCSHHFLKHQRSNNCKLSWRISNGCIQKQAVSGCPHQVCLYPKPYSLCPKLVNLVMPLLCKAGCKFQQNSWKKWCRLYRGIRWRFLVARSVMLI